jgi:hypothetical protein
MLDDISGRCTLQATANAFIELPKFRFAVRVVDRQHWHMMPSGPKRSDWGTGNALRRTV